jgi:GT2 family glycosyltransferase
MLPHAAPQSPPLVYVVTLTWNQCADTLHCLDSLARMSYPNYRLLLVDNASTDGTVEAVRARFPQVEIIVNAENLGFSGGFNAGLRHALVQGAGWVLIINNDTYVAPDLLDELIVHSDRPGVGMLGPKIYSAGEVNRIWSVGGRCSWWTYEMIGIGDGQMDVGQWDQPLERDYLVGCALLLKRSLLEEVGLFDADTFHPIYYEDSDLCLRARKAGQRLLLVPSARMWHKGVGASGGFDSPRQRYLMGRHSVRFFRKHVRWPRWLIVIPYRLGSAVKTTLRLLFAGRLQSITAYWRGLRDGVFGRIEPRQSAR